MDARGAFLEAIKSSTPSMDECDVVVPRDKIPEFVKFVDTLEERYEIRLRSFGHAGDGNIHVYVCKDDLDDETWKHRRDKVMEAMYNKSIELGGQVSGEHGIGHAKIGYLNDALGHVYMDLMFHKAFAFDPEGIQTRQSILMYRLCIFYIIE